MAHKPLIEFLAETSGDCCTFAFLMRPEFRKLTNKEIAERLGVCVRTACSARSQLNNGGYGCLGKPDCKGVK